MQDGTVTATFGGRNYVVREPQFSAMDLICDAAIANPGETTEPDERETSLRMYGFKLWKALEQDQPEVDSVDAALAILRTVTPQEVEEFKAKFQALQASVA